MKNETDVKSSLIGSVFDVVKSGEGVDEDGDVTGGDVTDGFSIDRLLGGFVVLLIADISMLLELDVSRLVFFSSLLSS